MRYARLVALLLGVGLIAATAAGYLARVADLERERDDRVRVAADTAAAEVRSTSDRSVLTARLADTPDAAVEALAAVGIAACAAPVATGRPVAAAMVCGPAVSGAAATRSAELVDDAAAARPLATGGLVTGALVTDGISSASIVAPGADVVVVVALSPSLAPDLVPTDEALALGEVVSVDGRRVAAANPLPGWAVVASTSGDVQLPPSERNLLLAAALGGVLLLVLAGVTLVTQQRRLVERASVDPVTRLPNRSEFEARGEALLQVARRGGEGVCLMLVDLDGFKAVNDTFGHAVGDEVLRVVGMRLRNAVRGYDLVARWGGDEFVIVLPGIDNERFATSRASSLAEIVSQPLRARDAADAAGGDDRRDGRHDRSVADVTLDAAPRVGASIGIALLDVHGTTLEELVTAADTAMYEAKRAGLDHRMATAPTLAACSPAQP